MTSQRQYIEDFQKAGRDPRSLPLGETAAFMDGAYVGADLADATRKAGVVVVGKVSHMRFVPDTSGIYYTLVDLSPEQVLKGDPRQITVRIGGAPTISEYLGKFSEAYVHPPGIVPLYEGDRVLLFLREGFDAFYVVPMSGQYLIVNDRVKVPEETHNRFAADVDSKPLADIVAQIKAATR